jgi:thioredoxin-related protein
MDKVPRPLVTVFSTYAFLSLPASVVLLLVVLLGLDGYSTTDFGILGALLVGLIGFAFFWRQFHARQSANVPETAEKLIETINQNGKYAVLAFESEFCLASTTVGQRLAALENAHPDRFQTYSISVLQDPGKGLFAKYGLRTTPTYVLLDNEGRVVDDFPLVLPVERVIYAVTQSASRA